MNLRFPLFCFLLLGFYGCGPRIDVPNPDDYIGNQPGSAAGPFEQIAYYGSWLAGIGMLAGIFMLWFKPAQAPRMIFISLSILVGAQAMLWISAHLGLITIVMILGGILYAGYRNKDTIEDIFDGETTDISAVPKPTPFTDTHEEPFEPSEMDSACIDGHYLR